MSKTFSLHPLLDYRPCPYMHLKLTEVPGKNFKPRSIDTDYWVCEHKWPVDNNEDVPPGRMHMEQTSKHSYLSLGKHDPTLYLLPLNW